MEEMPLEGQRDFEQSDDGVTQAASVLKRNKRRKSRSSTMDVLSCIIIIITTNKRKS